MGFGGGVYVEKMAIEGRHLKQIGTFSNADFCDGDGDRKSNLFPVDVLHFGGKPFSLRADVRTASFPLFTKREYILCFYALNIYHFFLISFPKASKRARQYKIGISVLRHGCKHEQRQQTARIKVSSLNELS